MNERVGAAIVVGVVGVLLGLLWLASEPGPSVPAEAHAIASAPLQKPAVMTAHEEPPPAPAVRARDDDEDDDDGEEAPPRGKLDPNSAAFHERIDDIIPARIYARAAECYRADLGRNEKMRLSVRIHAVDGEIFVTDVNVLLNTISDEGVAACVRDAVAGARWRDEEMPDWEDSDELFVRIRGMKKHLALADDD